MQILMNGFLIFLLMKNMVEIAIITGFQIGNQNITRE